MKNLTQDKTLLIEKYIKSNRKYSSNEDLYEDFYNETCKNSYALLSTVKSVSALELYLQKVVSNSMINVLKGAGRLRRTGQGYKHLDTVSYDEVVDEYNEKFVSGAVEYHNIDIVESPEDLFVKREILKNIAKTLTKIDSAEPSEKYLEIYKLRYEQGLTQREIADIMGISQSEVSKKLFRLMLKVKESLN
ncbi:sigma-70 family RNA polymerase sigma factor [bacterium]|nr:sigma-70 family RNA polymerase sigma factor [bacterium]